MVALREQLVFRPLIFARRIAQMLFQRRHVEVNVTLLPAKPVKVAVSGLNSINNARLISIALEAFVFIGP